MQTPRVSIIVPVYNGAETIEKCLRRIQHQTYSNLEVLVVDGGVGIPRNRNEEEL